MTRILQPRLPLPCMRNMSGAWVAGLVLSPIIGIIVSATALVSQIRLDRPCPTEGCSIVGAYASYGEIPMILLGIILFALLFFGGICSCFSGKWVTAITNTMKIIRLNPPLCMEILLVSSLALEGYLVAFQLFVAQAVCVFCLTVFALLVLTTVFFAVSVRPEILPRAGAVFATVFLGFILVSPGNNMKVTRLPDMAENRIQKGNPSEEFYLIYGKECPHCESIIRYCSEFNGNIDVKLCPIEKSGPLLSVLGINSVPTMIVNAPGRMEIIVGENRIIEYIESSNIYSTLNAPTFHHTSLVEDHGICAQSSPCIN